MTGETMSYVEKDYLLGAKTIPLGMSFLPLKVGRLVPKM
jgi:hypothetical protein